MEDFESPYIDEIMIRFPILFQGILNELDNKSLTKCRRINKEWQTFIDNERFVSFRKIQKYHSNMEEFFEQWKKVTQNASKETIGELSVVVHNFFEYAPACYSFYWHKRKRKEEQWSPLHITAEQGHLELSKYIIERTGDTNSKNKNGDSAFQMATEKGQLDVCKLIIESLENKNPRGYKGWTALHFAALNGHLEICKLINENIEDGATVENLGFSPVGCAAARGHFEVFKFLTETLQDKNQAANAVNWTPLHQAASQGHLEICRFIIDSGADKKPIGHAFHLGYTRWAGCTPLNIAAAEGHPRTCKLFIDEWADLIQLLKGILFTKNQNVALCLISFIALLFLAFIVIPLEFLILCLFGSLCGEV